MDRRCRTKPIDYLLSVQALMMAMLTVVILFLYGLPFALSVAFGCLIAIGNLLLQRWHIVRAVSTAGADAAKNLGRAHRCIAERWVYTVAMFAVGFGLLELDVLAVMFGFIIAQITLIFGFKRKLET